ncbi:MAG TPA: FAD-dependent oxidoreductase [Acetobacteraceae bacterium]|nr:FAD-dependent oxidoreductase [Acetobacteraceae bacterium]
MEARFDVIVVGFGYAGAVAAIAAHDAGARVLLLEKQPGPGGISVCSAGGVRCTDRPYDALAYLLATNGETTPEPVMRVLAEGMAEMPAFIGGLAAAVGATAVTRPATGNYPFPGTDAFGFVNVDAVPNFDAAAEYPAVRGSPAGARLFKVVHENVRRRAIEVRCGVRAERLIIEKGRVVGVEAGAPIRALGGVVLATGGFEGSPDLHRQFWQMTPVLSAALHGNTGDGLRMAQQAGASLWHLWHYHGSYGFRHPDPAYRFGIRLKRLPDWLPGQGVREDVTMSWVLVDRSGRRFMNEYEPYLQDTGHRPLDGYDFAAGDHPRLPAILIVDADGDALYPLCAPTWHDAATAARFGAMTPRAFDDAVLGRFETLAEIAAAFDLDPAALAATIAEWNTLAASGAPDRFGRPAIGRAVIARPPFRAAPVVPIVSNTQGGPAHDEAQRVLDAFGAPIPGLWEAGEIGSVFGHIYMSGGNLAECFVGGRIAGRNAAQGAQR